MKEDEKGNQEGGVPPENNGNNGKKKKRSRNKKGRDGSSPAPSSSSHASTSTADPSLRNNQMKPLKPSPIKETTPGQSSSQAPQPIRIVSRDPIESQRQVFENQRKNSSGKKEESPARGNNQQRYNANQNNRLSGYANNKFYPKPRKTQETFLKDGSNWNVGSKEALAVKNQRSAYYFSENAGQAPSVEDFSKTIQYEISAFPLKYNEPILISEKYDLMISSTSSKCDAWYVRVKSQNCHDTTQTVSAMLHRTSSDAQIRTACLECIENFDALQGGNGRKNERCPTSEASEEYLRSCFINKLSGPPEAFPEATYYCLRCDYHINSVSHAKQHLETSSHFDDVQRQQQRIDLFNNIPAPCQSQSRALKKMLMAERDEYLKKLKFTEENVSLVIRFLKNTLFESLGYSNVELQVYGSYTYDACLPDSDLNVAFSISTVETSQLYQLLGKIVEELRKVNIHAELVTELPNSAIVFEYENVPVRLCWLSNTVCFPQICLSKLLKTYVSLRPEIVQFIQLIRWWATRVGIDSKNKQKIGLPRYGFDLMAIHYLQQKNMIPVLHELFLEEDEEGNDPNASFHSEDSVKMILEEAREKRIRTFSKYLTDLEKINERFDLKKEWNWGCLWIDFFKYHAKKHRDGVIQITQKKPMSKDSTRWNRKLLHVVDPFRGDNVLSIPKVSSWLPYFFNSLLSTYLSFAIPRTSNGPIASVELYQKKVVSPSRKNQSRRGVTTEKKEVKKVQPEVEKSMFDVVNCTASELTAAQEEALEEREIEFHSEQIASRLEFDGIKLNKLKAEDVEIDEHHNRMYSRRTVVRVHRKYGYSKELKQEIDGNLKKFTLAKFKSPKKKTKNAQLDLEVAEKVEVESIENNGVERNDAEVFHVNCVMATPIERSPTPPTSTMWSYWQADSLAEAHCEYPACPPRGLKILKKEAKSDEVREKREEKTAKEDQPSTSTKPNCEFGEFPGSGTFVGNSTDYSRTTEDLICYEEFFIRGSLNGKELKRQTEGLCSEDFLYAFDPKLMTGGYISATEQETINTRREKEASIHDAVLIYNQAKTATPLQETPWHFVFPIKDRANE